MSHDDTAPLLCGTRAGYLRHIRLGEPPCDDCRLAQRDYVRDYRARTGNVSDRARDRALRRLARMHPAEYRLIYLEERDQLRADLP